MDFMKKVLLVATVTRKHIMQFHLPLIKMLNSEGWAVDVAAANDFEKKEDCKIPGCREYFDIPFERNPLHPSNLKAYRMLKKIIDEGHYDVVHCNTPVGGIIARLAAREARKKGTKVIYMAHGFHFYKGAPIQNWLIYYPAEKICSRMTDVLMTINQEDYALSCRRMHPGKSEYVPGIGIDLEKFRRADDTSNKISGNKKVILSVGELIPRKNHESVIRAIKSLGDPDIEYRICGDGILKEYLEQLARELSLGDQVRLLGYRKDIPEQLKNADLFILPSFQEGLPVALMEAMASKTMVLASDIRGNCDLLGKDQMFDPKNAKEIAQKIKKALSTDNRQQTEQNYEHLKNFSEETVLQEMKRIYEGLA